MLIAIAAAFTATLNIIDKNCVGAAGELSMPTIILDAGHGGEDGGAIASDGTKEKDINLAMTERIALLFELFGLRYVNIRDTDDLIGNNTLPTVRERKVSDIHQRMQIVTQTPGAWLLSIHQNFYLKDQYSGTQVFFAPHAEGSADIASAVQSAVVRMMQPDNTRQTKPTEGTVYLLDKAEKPSVMVECGFLSNPMELESLKDSQYQMRLAYCITRGVCDSICANDSYLE